MMVLWKPLMMKVPGASTGSSWWLQTTEPIMAGTFIISTLCRTLRCLSTYTLGSAGSAVNMS